MTNNNQPDEDKRLDEIIERLHPHGNSCFCEDDEFTKAEAKAALRTLLIEATLTRTNFQTYDKNHRIILDENHISITDSGVSFGQTKPPGVNPYCSNVYVDLAGHIRPHLNPTNGLYYFDGQVFYRKKNR